MTSKIVNEFNTNEHKIRAIKLKYNRNKKIGFFAFFALTSSMVMTIYEYASFASAGWGLILFLLIGGLCWFIPVAIMCAEMATVKGWEKGGLFTWVKWTLGPRWGFVAIFFQWFHITLGFITMLLFITTMLSFGFGGSEGLNNIWGINIYTTNLDTTHRFGDYSQTTTWATLGATFGVAILIFIIITLAQMFGIRKTTLISRIGFVIGIVIPFILLVIFGSIFISKYELNNSLQTGFLPAISGDNITDATVPLFQLVIFVTFILSYLGVEASASQINHLYKPKKNYPRVMVLLACIAILFGSIAGIFIAIATKVGAESNGYSLNFVAGIIQAFLIITSSFMDDKTAVIVTQVISVLMGLAVVAQISSWLVGPSQAMVETSKRGLFPAFLTKTNRFDVPYYMMLMQGCCVFGWALIIIFGFMGMQVSASNSGSQSGASNVGYLSAMKLTTLMYLISYFLLIIGYFQFFRKSKVSKTVVILKHNWEKYIIFVLGFLVNALAFIVAFFPQQDVAKYNTYGTYYGIMFGFFIPICVIPHIIYEYFWRKNKTKILKDMQEEENQQKQHLIEENKQLNNLNK